MYERSPKDCDVIHNETSALIFHTLLIHQNHFDLAMSYQQHVYVIEPMYHFSSVLSTMYTEREISNKIEKFYLK